MWRRAESVSFACEGCADSDGCACAVEFGIGRSPPVTARNRVGTRRPASQRANQLPGGACSPSLERTTQSTKQLWAANLANDRTQTSRVSHDLLKKVKVCICGIHSRERLASHSWLAESRLRSAALLQRPIQRSTIRSICKCSLPQGNRIELYIEQLAQRLATTLVQGAESLSLVCVGGRGAGMVV